MSVLSANRWASAMHARTSNGEDSFAFAHAFLIVRDPHVISLTVQKFDLWRTGWSIFVRIPRERSCQPSRERQWQSLRGGRLCFSFSAGYGVDHRMAGKHHNLRARWLLSMHGSSFKEITNLWNGFLVERMVLCAWRDYTHDEPEWVVQTPELSSTSTMRKWECNSISKDVAKKAGQWWTSVLVGSTP